MNSRGCNLLGLPVIRADVQSESVDAGGVGHLNVGFPVVLGVRVSVADHVVGDNSLGVRIALLVAAMVKRREGHGLHDRREQGK